MYKEPIEFKTSGKILTIRLICKNRAKLIKAYKNGEQQTFRSTVEIQVDDVNIVWNLVTSLKACIDSCEK